MKLERTQSVAKAVSGVGGGMVARSERFEVYASRHRCGDRGRREYRVSFSVVEVLSKEPRKIVPVELPLNYGSNLPKLLTLLSSKE
jgi:hypothetical protein